MHQLSPNGQQVIDSLATRHGFSSDATIAMLTAVINGNGRMAQFNHAEFCGSGQWMQGGMTMVSDMFNSQMKSRVDALCSELSSLIASEPALQTDGSFQSQSQGNTMGNQVLPAAPSTGPQPDRPAPSGPASLFVPPAAGASGNWWPEGLGRPDSAGAQNNMRYAWFGNARRLAIDLAGTVTLYDTLDHHIGGFSQQQSGSASVTFSSQYGLVDIRSLPVLAINGIAPTAAPLPAPQALMASSGLPATAERKDDDIFAVIEKLAELRKRDILTDEEFSAKKAELLSRI